MTYQFSKVTVLVVDSQPAMVQLIHGVLQLLGVRYAITRTDGKSGLKAFEEHKPDLMIIDWDLDSIDGIAFTKAVRESNNPYTPIIFMAAFSSEKRVLAARDSGVTEFLKKPFTAKQMFRRIEEIIERPRKFVKTEKFFGPDRRRKPVAGEYTGPNKRNFRPIEIDFIDRSDDDKKR